MPFWLPAAPVDRNPKLAGGPAALVATLGGPLGDVDHDAAALERANSLATGTNGATFSPLNMLVSGCLGRYWKQVWAIVFDGSVRIFESPTAGNALRTLSVSDCQCEVGEREDCKAGQYCFRLRHASGSAAFCAFDSKTLLLWLQALQAGGVKYEEPPVDITNVSSLFDLSATLLTGEEIDFKRYEGCVCLVVNAASK